jgi:acetyl esterase/lipase
VYPQVQYPVFLQDCALAVAWASAHAGEYGGGSRLFVMGHSAGAYNAMMLALDARWLGEAGLPPGQVPAGRLAGAIGLSGPYDFLPITQADIREVFGAAANDPSAQPITHVTSSAPPLFLATGSGDTTVRPGNTERLAARARAAGVPVTLRLYPGLGHIMTIAAVARPLRWVAPTLADVTAFVAARA